MAGISRRPIFLAGEHTERAIKDLVGALGGPWRRLLEGQREPGAQLGSASWDSGVEPGYPERPPALWRKGLSAGPQEQQSRHSGKHNVASSAGLN